jgi:hypothetical protein
VIAGTHVAFASLLYLGGATLFGYHSMLKFLELDNLGWS